MDLISSKYTPAQSHWPVQQDGCTSPRAPSPQCPCQELTLSESRKWNLGFHFQVPLALMSVARDKVHGRGYLSFVLFATQSKFPSRSGPRYTTPTISSPRPFLFPPSSLFHKHWNIVIMGKGKKKTSAKKSADKLEWESSIEESASFEPKANSNRREPCTEDMRIAFNTINRLIVEIEKCASARPLRALRFFAKTFLKHSSFASSFWIKISPLPSIPTLTRSTHSSLL